MLSFQSLSLRFFFVISVLSVTFACSDSNQIKTPDPQFAGYISAYTYGVVPAESQIVVRLQTNIMDNVVSESVDLDEVFDFSPAIDGQTVWLDNHTLAFIPDNKLASGISYRATFHLDKILETPKGLELFEFSFQAILQNFEVYIDGIEAYDAEDLELQKVKGRIVTADVAEADDILAMISAVQEDEEKEVTVTDATNHQFSFEIAHVDRKESPGNVLLTINGKPIGVDKKESKEIDIPALDDFSVSNIKTKQTPNQHLEIWFTDPISEQNLQGVITLEGVSDLRFSISGNTVTVYTSGQLFGNKRLNISTGLKNAMGYHMKKPFEKVIEFRDYKPEITMPGNGVILPSSNGLVVPFEAVNLKAVDLYIYKVFQNNVLQFFQDNSLNSNYSLNQVGRKIFNKRIYLKNRTTRNLKDWNRYYIDLSEYIEVEEGAIYKVEFRFKMAYSLYECEGEATKNEEELEEVEVVETSTEWNGYFEQDNYWSYYYDWDNRDNPCSEAYYDRYRCSVSKNIISSDIGLLAKAGGDGQMLFAVNNLLTAKPMGNVTIEVYDYQQQLLAREVTNGEGLLLMKLPRQPFMAVAKHQGSTTYLKLSDGEALSLSKFDVSGATVRNGVKGYLYGERGVWRPGDSLFLTFILEDKEAIIPDNHPVIFEMYNPQNQLIIRNVRTEGENGFYSFNIATPADAPTGNYLAKVKVGNRIYSKNIKIETIKPNRLKIYLDFGKTPILSAKKIQGEMEVKWLHGAVARNLKAKIDMTISATRTRFEKYDRFDFDDETRTFYTEDKTVFDSYIDADGKADIRPDVRISGTPGFVRLSFNTKVFEPGGNFSVDYYSTIYSPYSSYVGLWTPEGKMWGGALETDTKTNFEVVNLDEDGALKSGNKLRVEIFKISWQWWWDNYRYGMANYQSSKSVKKVKSEELITKNGKAEFSFTAPKNDYGQYMLRVEDLESGHVTTKTVYFDWPYSARSNRNDPEMATMLGFSTDKENYKIGENVKITFPSPADGQALIAIENGTKVLETFWQSTADGETVFEFPVTKEMSPNVYCHITLLQPHAATENDRPIRLYGVVPIRVEDGETHLNPVITCADVWRPETKVKVKVAEQNGREMTYTLAVVDEGLLDLTRFKTPNPWKHFYAREALGVKTWDMYDEVVGAYGAALQKLLSTGGDDALDEKEKKQVNRFKPMVRFVGPFTLKAGEKAAHIIDIPNYIGSVRVMVVAGKQPAYGSAEKTVAVRKPLMVLGTLPRVLSPGEEVALPVDVFAMEKHVKEVTITVKTNTFLEVMEQSTEHIRFSELGDKVVNFRLKVKEKTGIAHVRIEVKSGNETAYHEIALQVRAPNPPVTDIIDTVLKAGQSWTTNYAYRGIDGTNTGVLEITSIPPLDLEKRIDYLVRYPHGCVEQTVSAAFPQLYLDKLMKLDNDQKIAISENIQETLKALRNFQNSEGGFAYWPRLLNANDWGSSYAGHFMIEAENKGFSLPLGLKKRWLKYQKDVSRNWTNNTASGNTYSQLAQAYRLYTLALAGQPELAAMNNLREITGLSVQAKWRLAAAYQIAGQPEAAQRVSEGLSYNISPYREMGFTYGSDIRDKAMILETLSMMKAITKAAPLAKELAKYLRSDRWMSTQTTAFCLLAMSKFIGDDQADLGMKFSYALGKQPGKDITYSYPVFSKKLATNAKRKNGNISVSNKGKGILFVRLILTGIPVTDDRSASNENLKMHIGYTNMEGEEIDPSAIAQGTDFIAVVTLTNPGTRGSLTDIALTQMFPAGWEIINSRMQEGPSTVSTSIPTYQDIRDDRVLTYFDLPSKYNSQRVFRIQLNATYLGRFYLPTVVAEAMYDNSINARIPGQWIRVVKQQ